MRGNRTIMGRRVARPAGRVDLALLAGCGWFGGNAPPARPGLAPIARSRTGACLRQSGRQSERPSAQRTASRNHTADRSGRAHQGRTARGERTADKANADRDAKERGSERGRSRRQGRAAIGTAGDANQSATGCFACDPGACPRPPSPRVRCRLAPLRPIRPVLSVGEFELLDCDVQGRGELLLLRSVGGGPARRRGTSCSAGCWKCSGVVPRSWAVRPVGGPLGSCRLRADDGDEGQAAGRGDQQIRRSMAEGAHPRSDPASPMLPAGPAVSPVESPALRWSRCVVPA